MTDYTDALADLAVIDTTEFGEPTDYTPAGPGAYTARVSAVWGPLEVAEVGQGYGADTTVVTVQVAEVVDVVGDPVSPARGDTLTRYPDDLDAQGAWEVDQVRRLDATLWQLEVAQNVRPLP